MNYFPSFTTRVLRLPAQRTYHSVCVCLSPARTTALHKCNRWKARTDRDSWKPPCISCAWTITHTPFHSSSPAHLACQDSHNQLRSLGNSGGTASQIVSIGITEAEFEQMVTETLDSLTEKLEDLPDTADCSDDFDITFGDGVVTLTLGGSLGTYVINKQTPNKQIWLSSPTSGPKRYDYRDKMWIYSRNNEGLHTLLERELSEALKTTVDLSRCSFYS